MVRKTSELKMIHDAVSSAMKNDGVADKYPSIRGLFDLVSDIVDKIEDLDDDVYRLFNPNP